MKKYRCIKVVEAEPQKLTAEMAERFKGSNNKVGDDGYKVRYEDGYESWSPKEVFEKGYVLEPKDYKERLIAEYNDLTDKANKLATFIMNDKTVEELSVECINLLSLQLETMDHYRTILLLRMNNAGIDVSKIAEVDEHTKKLFINR